MFGWRKRIGHISPGSLSTSVYDFYLIAPEGVGLVGISNPINDWQQDEYERVLDNVVNAAQYLAARHVHFINHAGAPPMVTSDSGDFWYAFKTLGIRDVKPGYGILLDRLSATAKPEVAKEK